MDTRSGNCSEKCENNDKVGHRMTSSSTNSENCPGCGLSDLDKISITVAPTTGGRFDISVQKNIDVDSLKKEISKKLKVPKERILLLHKERQLREGNLQQNSIYHGSTLTLLPSVETGLLSQRPEQGVMQALESLNDSQVNAFLSGKAPLNLTMRLGDHMMLVQLQLSSVTPSTTRKSNSNVSLHQNSKANDASFPKPNVPSTSEGSSNSSTSSSSSSSSSSNSNLSDLDMSYLNLMKSKLNTLLHKNNENLNAFKRKLQTGEEETSVKKTKSDDDSKSRYFKDLNLKNVLLNVSEPTTTGGKSSNYSEMMRESTGESSKGATTSSQELQVKKWEDLSQILESLIKIIENTSEMMRESKGASSSSQELQVKKTEILSQLMEVVRKIGENTSDMMSPGLQVKRTKLLSQIMEIKRKISEKMGEVMRDSTGESSKGGTTSSQELQVKKTEILSQIMESIRKISENTSEISQTIEEKVCDKDVAGNGTGSKCNVNCTCSNKTGYSLDGGGGGGGGGGVKTSESAALDRKALAEASRNIVQTLKQLSSEVLTCRSENNEDCSTSSSSTTRRRPGTQGAIIESMQHHGKGVFSGTFSGTLNPALQDRFGRPKRDISTIIHILNDLLCATPQYRRQRQPQPQIKVQSHETSSVADKNSTATELVTVENEATRGKLERLRMVMEQNRARRRARREAKSSNTQNDTSNVDELESNNQDGSELMEINPPEPVVA